MCLDGPYTLDGNIYAGHKHMAYIQGECGGTIIVQYAIRINKYIYTSFIISYIMFYFTGLFVDVSTEHQKILGVSTLQDSN